MNDWPLAPGVVVLPDGRRVRGASLRTEGAAAGATALEPQFAVYLLARKPPAMAWQQEWVRWPDFRVPTSTTAAIDSLVRAHEFAIDRRVQVACGGGVGRTGTAIAFLAALAGLDPEEAVRWTRTHYHPRAVETPWQRRWVSSAFERYQGTRNPRVG
jgi:protein-tyrosine phosphatase